MAQKAAVARSIDPAQTQMPTPGASMQTPSESIVQGASQVFYTTDSRGRKIGVVRPTALLRQRLFRIIGPENSLNQRLVNELIMFMCVREVNGQQQFINTERQLNALVEQLDDEGMIAVATVFVEHFGMGKTDDDEETSDE